MSAAVEVTGLRKAYAGRAVVDGVSFSVDAGQVLGLLGPNGAGKTTALECIEGLRRADAGQVVVCGLDPAREAGAFREAIGVQLQLSALPPPMTPREALRVFSRYHGQAPRPELLTRFGIEASAEVPYSELSVGQQRRLNLALAIAHRPKVVFLDEPTAGLDVASRVELHAVVRELKQEGAAVVLATHDMAEAEGLADQLVILMQGRVIAQGTPRELTAAGPALTKVSIGTTGGCLRLADAAGLPGVERASEGPGLIVLFSRDAGATVAALVEKVRAAGDTLSDLRVERPSLEERFLQLTGAAS